MGEEEKAAALLEQQSDASGADFSQETTDFGDTPATLPDSEAEKEPMGEEAAIDYESLVLSDMEELGCEFSGGIPFKVSDLKNPERYGELRDLGLSPREAFLASGGAIGHTDNRSHLSSSVPRNMTAAFSEIPRAHLNMARDLFSELSDSEIKSLYKRVTQ
ncbi:MAG: hypothetical protein J6Q68_01410 [Clostridia bacterium]|nr:hypothetical protein [Clostridia bacterium]